MIDRFKPYVPPFFLRNGHFQTIYPTLFRTVTGVDYCRERIVLADGDFLDLDWSRAGSRQLGIVSHGLEGNARRDYVRGMVRALNQSGIDALAWNYRGCSGVPNNTLRMYHNGAIDDLHTVIQHALTTGSYEAVFLIGFSLGGNLSLLYLGKQAESVPQAVKAAVGFSVPCDLTDASIALEKRVNGLYMKRFLILLHDKIKAKQHLYPEALDDTGYARMKTFRQFDDRYTAPIHGFKDAQDYWRQCSCRPWIEAIRVPAVIVNALDDPFLSGGCYPEAECAQNHLVTLVTPRWGGHVGFMALNSSGRYWSEDFAMAFIGGF